MELNILLEYLYPASGLIMLMFYIPQVTNVLRSQSDLRDISIGTWGVWAICTAITALYGYLVLEDSKITLFSSVGSFFCFLIFTTTVFKRYWYRDKRGSSSKIELKISRYCK